MLDIGGGLPISSAQPQRSRKACGREAATLLAHWRDGQLPDDKKLSLGSHTDTERNLWHRRSSQALTTLRAAARPKGGRGAAALELLRFNMAYERTATDCTQQATFRHQSSSHASIVNCMRVAVKPKARREAAAGTLLRPHGNFICSHFVTTQKCSHRTITKRLIRLLPLVAASEWLASEQLAS